MYGEKSCSQLAIALKKMEAGILAAKPSSEDKNLNRAMDTILKADPAMVKAQMEAAKKESEEQRKVKAEKREKKRPRKPSIDHHNLNPKPFIWTTKASDILQKVTRAQATLNKHLSV